MYDDELIHWGILGQKWGIRRFQPYSTTGPRKGGKTGKEIGEAAKKKVNVSRYDKDGRKLSKKEYQAKKEKMEKLAAGRAKAQEQKKQKTELLKNGKASDILSNKSKFSNDELEQVRKRLELEEKLSSYASKEKSEKMQKFDKAVYTLSKASEYAGTIADAGKKFKNAYDFFNEISTKKEEDVKKKRINALVKNGTATQVMANLKYLTPDQEATISKRLSSEKIIKEYAELEKKQQEAAQQEQRRDRRS